MELWKITVISDRAHPSRVCETGEALRDYGKKITVYLNRPPDIGPSFGCDLCANVCVNT